MNEKLLEFSAKQRFFLLLISLLSALVILANRTIEVNSMDSFLQLFSDAGIFSLLLTCFFYYFYLVGILLICWLFYLVIFYPGIATWDTHRQVMQGVGIEELSNQHPIIHTLIIGSLVRLGRMIFGNINDALIFYTVAQMIINALVYAYVIQFVAQQSNHRVFAWSILCFYALNPLIACFSITLWKDITISTFLLLYIVHLTKISENSNEYFSKKRYYFFFALIISSVLFSKSTGIIMIILSLPFLLWTARKHWKQLSATFLIIFSLYFFITGPMLQLFHIRGINVHDTMSVPVQQIARTVRDHGEDLTEEEQQIISEIFPYEKLASLYNPILSDKIKDSLNLDKFNQNKSRYIKTWLKLGMKFPLTYLNSFLANSNIYWYPDVKKTHIVTVSYLHTREGISNLDSEYLTANHMDYERDVTYKPLTPFQLNIKSTTANILHYLQLAPFLWLFFNIGVYTWICFVLFMICLYRKQYELLPIFAVLLGVFISSIMSPVNGEMRYIYTIIVTTPYLISIIFRRKNREEK